MVKAANWLSHLEFDQESPVWRHYIDAFSSRFSYLRYDERGSGLSDWDVDSLAFDDWVADLEAVVDAAGFDRFPLLGISQGGAVAIEYAVRHPERVSHLILDGAYSRGRLKRDEGARQQHELHLKLIEVGWGTDLAEFRHVFTAQFIPGGTPAQHAWFDELMRRSTSTENALRFRHSFGRIDVSDRAPLVTTPTLVFHSVGDRRVPFEEGRRLASLIPGARLVPLDSDNHILLEHEPAWHEFLSELVAFVSDDGARAVEAVGSPALLMTDMVESTRLIEVIGDEAWVDLLSWHDRTLEQSFAIHRGRVIDHTGDGYLVSFPTAADAVGCAVDVQRMLATHRKTAGFAPQIRAGIHRGTVRYRNGKPAGREVHLAARVMAAAGAGEILVSEPVAAEVEHARPLGEPRAIPAKGLDGEVRARAVLVD